MGKDKTSTGLIIMAGAMVVILGATFFMLFFGDSVGMTVVNTGTTTTTTSGGGSSGSYECPTGDLTNVYARYEDKLDSATNTYGVVTLYYMPKTTGQVRQTANTLQTGGAYNTANELACSANGVKWEPVAVASQDNYHSAVGAEFVSAGPEVRMTIPGKAFGHLQMKVKDADSEEFYNISGCGTETNDWVTFNGSQCAVEDNTATGTSLTMGTGDNINAMVYLRTNASETQYGEDGLKTLFLVDASTSVFQTPVVKRDGGAALNNLKDSNGLSNGDARRYGDYEYAYDVGSFDRQGGYVNFYIEGLSGINPTNTDDPIVEICSESRYNSVKSADTINIGCWTDAATQTQVSQSARYLFGFSIS